MPLAQVKGSSGRRKTAPISNSAFAIEGVPTRVVSMPCQEWFDQQSEEYREQVLPAAVTARVSIEAGIAMGWAKYVGAKGASVSIESFGASAAGAGIVQNCDVTAKVIFTGEKWKVMELQKI